MLLIGKQVYSIEVIKATQCTVTLLLFRCQVVSNSLRPRAALPKGIPRQEHWSGMSFPSPEDLPDPWADSLPLNYQGSQSDIVCELSRFSHALLCSPMGYSPPGSSVHGILPARILKWVAMPSSRGSSQLSDQIHMSYVSFIARQVLYH